MRMQQNLTMSTTTKIIQRDERVSNKRNSEYSTKSKCLTVNELLTRAKTAA